MKKAREPVLYALSSLSSFALDAGLFYAAVFVLDAMLGVYAEPVGNLISKLISSFYNFNMNRLVFRRKGDYGGEMLRYYSLWFFQTLASTGLITLFVNLLRTQTAMESTTVKVVVYTCLFVASFFIQKYWVFKERKTNSGEMPEDKIKQN